MEDTSAERTWIQSDRPPRFSFYRGDELMPYVHTTLCGESPAVESPQQGIAIIFQDIPIRDLLSEGEPLAGSHFEDQAYDLAEMFRQHEIEATPIPGSHSTFVPTLANYRVVIYLGHSATKEGHPNTPIGLTLGPMLTPQGSLKGEDDEDDVRVDEDDKPYIGYREIASKFGLSVDGKRIRRNSRKQPCSIPQLLVLPTCNSTGVTDDGVSLPELWQAIGVKWLAGCWRRIEGAKAESKRLADTINRFVFRLVKLFLEGESQDCPTFFRQAQGDIDNDDSLVWPGVFQLYKLDGIPIGDTRNTPPPQQQVRNARGGRYVGRPIDPAHYWEGLLIGLAIVVILLIIAVAMLVANELRQSHSQPFVTLAKTTSSRAPPLRHLEMPSTTQSLPMRTNRIVRVPTSLPHFSTPRAVSRDNSTRTLVNSRIVRIGFPTY